jgi:hypothetical protein
MADDDKDEKHEETKPVVTEEVRHLTRQELDDAIRKVRNDLNEKHDAKSAEDKREKEELRAELKELTEWRTKKEADDEKREESGGSEHTLVMPPAQAMEESRKSEGDESKERDTHDTPVGEKKRHGWKRVW